MNDLVFISLEDWDEVWRRNQFVCSALAKRHPDMKILFVGLARDMSNRVRRLRFKGMFDRLVHPIDGFSNITTLHPVKWLPNTLAAGRAINERMMRGAVKKAMRSMGMRAPIVWINDHSAAHVVGRLGEAAAVYDITDDWTAFTQSDALTQRIIRQDAFLCRHADAVIVCSERLREMKAKLSPRVELIPNGVDAAHYATVLDQSVPVAAAARGWKRPVFGYTGSIHPDRVDLELIATVARQMPEATVALVGPNMLPGAEADKLAALGNVIFTGAVPYHELPAYMRAFDVCITPHRMTAFTESLNPIKLWEYLAAGKPIVATDVAGFRDFPQHVRIARTAEQFTAALREALAESRSPAAISRAHQRQAEARNHSWDSRVDRIEEVLHRATAREHNGIARRARDLPRIGKENAGQPDTATRV